MEPAAHHPQTFREIVERDIYNRSTVEEKLWLRQDAQLIRWLTALKRISTEVEAHIGRDAAALKAIAPDPGTPPSEDYLERKRAVAANQSKRINFKRHVESRISEVAEMVNAAGLTPFLAGQIVAKLLGVRVALDELRVADADEILAAVIEQLSKHAG